MASIEFTWERQSFQLLTQLINTNKLSLNKLIYISEGLRIRWLYSRKRVNSFPTEKRFVYGIILDCI